MTSFLKKPQFHFLLILLAALLLRFLYLADFAQLPLLGQVVGPDVSEYYAEAQRIRAGHWLPADSLSIHAPLYPYVLALFLSLTGGDLFLTRLLQSSVFCLLTLLPLFLLLRRQTAGLSCGLRFLPQTACLLLALYPPLVIYQSEFFSENLMLVLMLFSLWSFTRHTPAAELYAGIFAGLAVLAHPGCVFLIPFAGLYAWFRLRSNWKKRLLRTALFAAGAALLILPVCIRNSRLAGHAVLIQGNSGLNLYLGNSAAATGTCWLPPGSRWDKTLDAAGCDAARQGISRDAFFRNEVFRYLTRFPADYARKLLKKAAMSVSAREFTTWSDATALGAVFWHKYLFHGWFMFLLLPGGPVLLTGLFRRRFRRNMSLELLLFVSIFAGQIFLLTSGRYRLPLIVPLAVFAGYFLCVPKRFLGNMRQCAYTLAALVFVFGAGTYPYAIPRQPEREYARSLLASAQIKAGNPRAAVELYAGSASGDFFPDRRLSILGQAWYELGDLKQAGKYFRQSVKDFPGQTEGYLNYASVLSASGQDAEAEKLLKEALKRPAKTAARADLFYNLGEIAQRNGRLNQAEEYYGNALKLQPAHFRAMNNLGAVHLRRNQPEQALPLFERASKLNPANVLFQVNHALALAMCGREPEARRLVQEILRREPDCLPAQRLLKALPPER
ncbi:MAG: tetratricopeptide repeat protein [Lentisphaeria bacterium]|nr:tetratricopeptide repeat protein [Lentisphaeria bacterium]